MGERIGRAAQAWKKPMAWAWPSYEALALERRALATLGGGPARLLRIYGRLRRLRRLGLLLYRGLGRYRRVAQIGRASCRERVSASV